MRPPARTAWASALALVLLSAGVVPASAADPNWYVDSLGMEAIHASGIDGSGVTIAVIDSGINLEAASLQGADITVLNPVGGCLDEEGNPRPLTTTDITVSGHGTAVTSMIVGQGKPGSTTQVQGVAPAAKILFISSTSCLDAAGVQTPLMPAIRQAIDAGADIVSISSGAMQAAPRDLMVDALVAQVPIVVGIANPLGSGLGTILPGMPGFLGVAAVDSAGTPLVAWDADALVAAPGVDVAGDGEESDAWGLSSWSGSSAATPIVSGVLALAQQKWPNASMNQLEQLLIHTAGSAPAVPVLQKGIGFGLVNPSLMMSTDPSQYPEVSPLIKEGRSPTQADVDAASAASATPTARATTGDVGSSEPNTEFAAGVLPLVLGLGAGILFVGIGVTLVVIFVVRRSRHGATRPEA